MTERVFGLERNEGDWEGYDVSKLVGITSDFGSHCERILEERGTPIGRRERVSEILSADPEDRDVVEFRRRSAR